jgi:hypothetical protein
VNGGRGTGDKGQDILSMPAPFGQSPAIHLIVLVILPLLLLGACSLRPPEGAQSQSSAPQGPTAPAVTAVVAVTPAVPLVGSTPGVTADEPSPPGGLGNVVESFSRHFGRPPAAFGVSQPSYAYGQWPTRGLYVILDDSFRRAQEVHVNFGKTLALADARAQARQYLPSDARQLRTFTEAGTGDPGELYESARLAAVFPKMQPPGNFVVIYDGAGDQITGLILRMGSSQE